MTLELGKLSTEELGKLFPIHIVEYNPKWLEIYQTEKEKIVDIINKNWILSINHIGSTAIPGIMAKPTIDILIEVTKSFDKEIFLREFENIGYHYIPQPENPAPHIMLAKGYTPEGFKGQSFHVHVRYKGDWNEIYFRDYLIQHPETAKAYEKLKLELANKHKYNREDYKDAKTEFIKEVMKLAKSD
jgi:GrpB-like predicted nucleotidyltransferase (UPF0157 family)